MSTSWNDKFIVKELTENHVNPFLKKSSDERVLSQTNKSISQQVTNMNSHNDKVWSLEIDDDELTRI